MQAEHLRPMQAAEYLGLAPGTLANWRTRRIGPTFSKLGALILYRREDLDRWVERGRQSTEDAQ